MNWYDKESLKFFDWEQLNNLTLNISVGVEEMDGYKTICVIGKDLETGVHYVMHNEIKLLERNNE